ncbi:MAG: DUF359 domain-containing protein [Candidatus Aenigmatarchaeota archaeon]|nr:DUF359 domain-containing protein [Candidatus Aenigmarchaeota archaeon]
MFVLNNYKLPEELRKEFKIAYGQIYSSVETAKKQLEGKTIICVGDRISYNAISHGIKPKMIIFDKKEQRKETEIKMRSVLETFSGKTIKARNPASHITAELWNAVKKGFEDVQPVKIMVDGEEDLAFLPVVLEAEVNDVVLYGFFDKGFVLTIVDNNLKKRCKELLSKFQVLGS